MSEVINPSAPEFNPDFWNDFNWASLAFFISAEFPEIVEGLKGNDLKITPNNIGMVLREYSDTEIAIALKIDREKASEFRESILTLMQARQLSTNCFCHAADDSGPFPAFMKPWPGMLQGLTPSDGDVYETGRLIEVTEASGAKPIGLEPVQSEGVYNVALLLRSDKKEIHYARENRNGEYSHKDALGPALNIDNSGRIITDPTKADWGSYRLVQMFHFPEGGLEVGIPKEERPERPTEVDELFSSISHVLE